MFAKTVIQTSIQLFSLSLDAALASSLSLFLLSIQTGVRSTLMAGKGGVEVHTSTNLETF